MVTTLRLATVPSRPTGALSNGYRIVRSWQTLSRRCTVVFSISENIFDVDLPVTWLYPEFTDGAIGDLPTWGLHQLQSLAIAPTRPGGRIGPAA